MHDRVDLGGDHSTAWVFAGATKPQRKGHWRVHSSGLTSLLSIDPPLHPKAGTAMLM